jgi:4-diphosphocytidyl-2-C-methyl-D-erythritol kinase
MKAHAPAKLNLSLRVFPPREDRFHPLDSIVQTLPGEILWADQSDGETDTLELVDQPTLGGDLLDGGGSNLVLRAVRALRAAGAEIPPLHFRLRKTVPVAAGLGGGSGDAAAALALAAAFADPDTVPDLATVGASIGSDVPALLRGGTLRMEGRGEIITPLPFAGGYGVLLWVPAFGLSTPAVYRRFDELGFPRGPTVEDVPESLQSFAPLANDLIPAAESLEPRLAEHRRVLAGLLERPVLMSGSGTSLFSFFDSPVEAKEAAHAVAGDLAHLDPVARMLGFLTPTPHGVSVVEE